MKFKSRKIALIACSLFLVGNNLRADELGAPPITRETLYGVWEAAPPGTYQVWRMELNRTGPSYLSVTLGSEDLVYQLVSSDVRNGHVKLRFHCLTDRRLYGYPRGHSDDLNYVVITGKGQASERFGGSEASVGMRYRSIDEWESTQMTFVKPACTRDLTRSSKKSEALIKRAKRNQFPR